MKKVVSINLGNHGSTGKIMKGISLVAQENGYETYMAFPASLYTRTVENNDIIICSSFWNRVNQKVAYYTGLNGCFAPLVTRKFLERMDQINPNIFHFHNLHNSYINLPMLFNYVKQNQIKVLWTLHDCWAFTGHCPYFTLAACDKWKTGCGNCPQLNIYPPARIDKTKEMWERKKQWFSGVENLTIVTPSEWLAGLVKQSFLSQYPIKVINNGIDLTVFKPTESNIRSKYNISDEKIVLLGVSFGWGERKGIDVFKYLANKLDQRYQIILVGTDATIDRELPSNIISIHRTQNQLELASIYTAADLLINPTREDTFPTVNIEALSCGTPVITFNTGGSPEIINEKCGMVVDVNDFEGMLKVIEEVCEKGLYKSEDCITRAKEFESRRRFLEYVKLYED